MSYEEYVLGNSDTELQRLNRQACIFDRQSRPFLSRFVSPGQHVLEVGCGTGGVSSILASLLDNTGSLVGIEQQKTYADFTKHKLHNMGIANFDVQVSTIEDATLTDNHFDVICCRAVLHHIKDPKSVLKKLVKALKPGGFLLCEEPVMNTVLSFPKCDAYHKLFDWYLNIGEATDTDFLIGDNLYVYYQEFGLDVTCSQYAQTALITPDERKIIPDALEVFQRHLLEHKIASRNEIKEAQASLET